jgi:hypothetical protein
LETILLVGGPTIEAHEHGDKRVTLLKRKHIEAMFKEKTSKRFAARH